MSACQSRMQHRDGKAEVAQQGRLNSMTYGLGKRTEVGSQTSSHFTRPKYIPRI